MAAKTTLYPLIRLADTNYMRFNACHAYACVIGGMRGMGVVL